MLVNKFQTAKQPENMLWWQEQMYEFTRKKDCDLRIMRKKSSKESYCSSRLFWFASPLDFFWVTVKQNKILMPSYVQVTPQQQTPTYNPKITQLETNLQTLQQQTDQQQQQMDQQQQQMNQMLKQTAQVLTSFEDRITNLEKKDDRVVLFEVRERLQKIEEKTV